MSINIGDLVRIDWSKLSHALVPDKENGGLINPGNFFREHGHKVGVVLKQRNYKSGQRCYITWCGEDPWDHMSLPTYVLKVASVETLEEDLKTVERLNRKWKP